MNAHSDTPAADNSDWEACAPGTLTGLSGRMRAERRARNAATGTAMTGAGLVAVLALVFVAAYATFPAGAAAEIRRINCRECIKLFPVYHDDVESDTRLGEDGQAVKQHLDRCGRCRQRYADRYPAAAAAAAFGIGLFAVRRTKPRRRPRG